MSHRFHLPGAAFSIISLCGCITVNSDPHKLPDSINLPAIRQAYATKTKMQRELQEVTDAGRDLDDITTRVSYHPIAMHSGSAETVVKTLIESTHNLHEAARAILDKAPRYIDKLDGFAGSLQTAPATFTNAAKLFRTFAEEEPYTDIADDYRQVAILFDKLALCTQGSSAKVQERYNRAALLETLQYIRHQERLLDRFEAALYALDSGLGGIDAFLQEIATYTRKFQELQTQIRTLNTTFPDLHDQLTPPQGEKPSPLPPKADNPAPPEPAAPPKRNPPVQLAPTQSRTVAQVLCVDGVYLTSFPGQEWQTPTTAPQGCTPGPINYATR